MEVAQRLARLSKEMGASQFIHLSALTADKNVSECVCCGLMKAIGWFLGVWKVALNCGVNAG